MHFQSYNCFKFAGMHKAYTDWEKGYCIYIYHFKSEFIYP